MKTWLKDALLMSMLSALAWSVSASTQSPQTVDGTEQPPRSDNIQGASISAQEHAANAEAMFKQMDADGDGTLTSAELDAGRQMMMGVAGQQGSGPGGSDAGSGPETMGHGMGHGMMGPAMMDRDGDGFITAQEHADMARTMFERMDSDGDGRVSTEEMASAHRSMMGGAGMQGAGRGMGAGPGMGLTGGGMGLGMSSSELIQLMDLDGDGRISASEYSAGTRAMFEEADTDNDGSLSMSERAAHHEAMMRRTNDSGQDGGG